MKVTAGPVGKWVEEGCHTVLPHIFLEACAEKAVGLH